MDNKQIIARTHALYRILPNCGFSSDTFEELGRAAKLGTPYGRLSAPLRGTLMILVRDLFEAHTALEVEEMISAASEEVLATVPTETPAPVAPVVPEQSAATPTVLVTVTAPSVEVATSNGTVETVTPDAVESP